MTIKHDKVLPAHPLKIHETRPSGAVSAPSTASFGSGGHAPTLTGSGSTLMRRSSTWPSPNTTSNILL